MFRALALSSLIALACADVASGATVRAVETCVERFGCSTTVEFVAAPGEANDVRVVPEASGVVISDRAAPVEAGAGCSAVDPHAARCATGAGTRVVTGDGDDHVTGGGSQTGVDLGPGDDAAEDVAGGLGGEGNDTIRLAAGDAFLGGSADGGPGDDRLIGNAGKNFLTGGTGSDLLDGAGGDDWLDGSDAASGVAEAPARDVLLGGPGLDHADYFWRRRGIAVVLPDRAGEDQLVGVEGVGGSFGDDTMHGDAGPNGLDGGPSGRDKLLGGGGDDRLVASGDLLPDRLEAGDGDDFLASHAADELVAGAGDDLIRVGGRRAGPYGSIRCGTGRDRVEDPKALDELAADCERLRFPSSGGVDTQRMAFDRPKRTRRRLSLRVPCRYAVGCRIRVTATSMSGRRIAHRTLVTRRAATRTAGLALEVRGPLRLRVVVERRRGRFRGRIGVAFRVPQLAGS